MLVSPTGSMTDAWATWTPVNIVCRTVEVAIAIAGAAIAVDLAYIECRPVEHDPICPCTPEATD